MASSSSVPSQPAHKIEYDVFLSFKGEDTGKTFVDHLYKELQRKGIRTFKDDEGLEKGQRIVKLLQIIKKSRFAIVVFSKDYASAKWCLEEIATIMECQQQYAQEFVIPIFYDVEPSVVRNQTESFGESFKRHEEENTEKAKVERWKEALKKAGKISGYHLQDHFNGFEAKCVEMVTNDIFTRVNRSIQASSTVLDNFVGLETRVGNVGFQQLPGLIVDYCMGLPLGLKILGSSLCGLEAVEWESTLKQLKDTPNDDIHAKLMINFDGLDDNNKKNLFAYCICLFKKRREEVNVRDLLESDLRVLIDKSIISVKNGKIEMHDLIQEMGWHIILQDRDLGGSLEQGGMED